MATTDARPIPIKNTAFRVTFPILDSTGALVVGASSITNVLIRDATVVTAAAGAVTQIGSSGMYYLDLTSAEMGTADTVAIIISSTTSGSKPTPIVLYPQEAGDIKVDVQSLLGTAWLTPTTAGTPDINVKQINADATSAANLAKTTLAIGRGTVGGTPSTTSIPTSAFSLASASTPSGQFVGRIITFDALTTTLQLRGQATDITASGTGATPTFTVTALTTAPAVGDLFSVT